MSDTFRIKERLESVLEALERIPRRIAGMSSAADCFRGEAGRDRLDGICMIRIAAGEAMRQIDRKSEGKILARYPEVNWAGVKGVRDVIAHGYFDVDHEEVFEICQTDVPLLIRTLRKMVEDLQMESGA